MELLYFIWSQFKIPILGLTILGLLAWIRFFVLPVGRVLPDETKGYQEKEIAGSPGENASDYEEH